MNLKGTKTEKNLLAAFAGESQARNKYTYFASVAKKEGYEQIAAIFQKTADNEKEHAKMWFKALGELGDTAENLIMLAESKEVKFAAGKRTFVNLDTISANYKEGETVDLASLKARGLIDKKAAAFKVLARGTLDKSLTVEASDFSLSAVKMIVLTGGRVVRLKKV